MKRGEMDVIKLLLEKLAGVEQQDGLPADMTYGQMVAGCPVVKQAIDLVLNTIDCELA